jgi:hypothetical protein
MLGSALTFSLVEILSSGQMLGAKVKPLAAKWLMEVRGLTSDLRGRKLRPVEWQERVEDLFRRIDLADLLRSIDYAKLAKAPLFPEDHESALELEFPHVRGLPAELTYVPMFIALKRGRAIVPHGHHNMASMHMVLDGEVHARHYEKRGGDDKYLIVEPTLDTTFARGDLSTVSDERNNVHWFKALTDSVFMLNVAAFGIDGTKNYTGRDYIDPLGGQKLGDGTIRARRLTDKEAFKLYGNS